MVITTRMENEVKEQIKKAGIKNKNGTYIFYGKNANLVLKDKKIEILSINNQIPFTSKMKVLKLINEYIEIDCIINEKRILSQEGNNELIHLILKCNGQPGFTEKNYIINYLDEYAARNNAEF